MLKTYSQNKFNFIAGGFAFLSRYLVLVLRHATDSELDMRGCSALLHAIDVICTGITNAAVDVTGGV